MRAWRLAGVILMGLAASAGAAAPESVEEEIDELLERDWRPFPYDQEDYGYPDESLERSWRRLHRGDLHPYPSAASLRERLESWPEIRATIPGFDGDYGALAQALQEAWRLYHRGAFRRAYEAGRELGLVGDYVAGRAWGVYAFYLAPDEDTRLRMLRVYMERVSALHERFPNAPSVNLHFGLAYVMGRYGDEIGVSRALSLDLAGRIRRELDHVLDEHPNHYYARTALGSWHAKVIHKAGSLIGRLRYGATEAEAMRHFRTVIRLAPELIAPRVELAEALRLLGGAERRERAAAELREALELSPLDAQQRLEQDRARRMLQALQEEQG